MPSIAMMHRLIRLSGRSTIDWLDKLKSVDCKMTVDMAGKAEGRGQTAEGESIVGRDRMECKILLVLPFAFCLRSSAFSTGKFTMKSENILVKLRNPHILCR